MANPNQSEKSTALDREENITKGNVAAKRVALFNYNSGTDALEPFSAGLVTAAYDYISLSPDSSRPVTVVYKSGGSGGTTVATLTIAYDGTTSNITSVTRS